MDILGIYWVNFVVIVVGSILFLAVLMCGVFVLPSRHRKKQELRKGEAKSSRRRRKKGVRV